MTEELKYEVVKKFPNFEIRRYPDYVLAQVEGTGEFNAVTFSAFSPLSTTFLGRTYRNNQ